MTYTTTTIPNSCSALRAVHVETHSSASLRRACAIRRNRRAAHVGARRALPLRRHRRACATACRYAANFLLASILFLGLMSCQSNNDTPPPIVLAPPAWQGIPPMPPVNSEDPTLLPTVKIPMPQDCVWNVSRSSDYERYTYFFLNSYKELKESIYCFRPNYYIPTVDFNTYTMLGFICSYGDTIIHQSLRKESDSVYNLHLEVEKANKGYWESAILMPKLPQDSRIKVLIDYKPEPGKEVINTTPFTLENCYWINVAPNIVHVINSIEELANYVACESELPQVDFSKQTVLVVAGPSNMGIANVVAELSKTGTEYFLNVDVLQNDAAVAEPWRIAVLTDKITTNNIKLNVNYRHN